MGSLQHGVPGPLRHGPWPGQLLCSGAVRKGQQAGHKHKARFFQVSFIIEALADCPLAAARYLAPAAKGGTRHCRHGRLGAVGHPSWGGGLAGSHVLSQARPSWDSPSLGWLSDLSRAPPSSVCFAFTARADWKALLRHPSSCCRLTPGSPAYISSVFLLRDAA